MLGAVLAPRRLAGVDRSEAFLAAARTHAPTAAFVLADLTAPRLPIACLDLAYARFVVGHLAAPEQVVGRWASCLRPAGVLLLDDVERIDASLEPFVRYLALTRQRVADHGGELFVGPRLDALAASWAGARSHLVEVQPSIGQAAQMFALNLATWRDDDWARRTVQGEQLAILDEDLRRLTDRTDRGEIVWTLRQVTLPAPLVPPQRPHPR